MPELPETLDRLLDRVRGPGQYVGGEPNAIVKPAAAVRFRVALAFPDAYAVGMSCHGTRILYDIANRLDGVACERVFTPLPDMEAALRDAGLPLGTLETHTPLRDCDAVAFSLQSELGAANLLTMLDLGGIPLLREARGPGDPFVLAGGHGAFNPEPLADFVDAFLVGEGEEALPEMLALLDDAGRRHSEDRAAALLRLAKEVEGVYAPALYETAPNAQGFEIVGNARDGAPPSVRKRIVRDLNAVPQPTAPVVPVHETAHERVTVEILRGCPNGCRFCQAGMICRPTRERSVESLVETALACFRNTGYDEVGLLSLSTSDHSRFDELVARMDEVFAPRMVNLSLPSLRVDHALAGIPKRFRSVRRGGFTLAPEAGTDRLRASINKHVTDEDLLTACAEAYAQGWKSIKLYFMIGLPGETDDDVTAIADLANRVARLRRGGARKAAVNLSVSSFVPKPHTPFQWEAMNPPDELRRKQDLIAEKLDRRRIHFGAHDVAMSHLEGLLARGDRRLGKVILRAWRLGARLDAWTEHFRPHLWEQAFGEEGVASESYLQERTADQPLPWSHIDAGPTTEFFLRERQKSLDEQRTAPCSDSHCAGCGISKCAIRDIREH